MARTPGNLKPEAIEPVLGYLKVAALRGSDAFRPGVSPAGRLAVLERELAGTPVDYKHQALGEWVARHLTPEGRTRMLATLRRRRADAKGKPKAVSMRLAPDDAKELQVLARTLDMPSTLVVRTLVAIAAADKDLRSQMVRLGVAMKLGGAGTKETR